MTAAKPPKRSVVVELRHGDDRIALTYPVAPNTVPTVPAVVAAALYAENPPVITITVVEETGA